MLAYYLLILFMDKFFPCNGGTMNKKNLSRLLFLAAVLLAAFSLLAVQEGTTKAIPNPHTHLTSYGQLPKVLLKACLKSMLWYHLLQRLGSGSSQAATYTIQVTPTSHLNHVCFGPTSSGSRSKGYFELDKRELFLNIRNQSLQKKTASFSLWQTSRSTKTMKRLFR